MENDLGRMILRVLDEAKTPLPASEIALLVRDHTEWEMRGWLTPTPVIENRIVMDLGDFVDRVGVGWCLRPKSLRSASTAAALDVTEQDATATPEADASPAGVADADTTDADQIRRVLGEATEPLSALAIARTIQPTCRSSFIARVQTLLNGPLASDVDHSGGLWTLIDKRSLAEKTLDLIQKADEPLSESQIAWRVARSSGVVDMSDLRRVLTRDLAGKVVRRIGNRWAVEVTGQVPSARLDAPAQERRSRSSDERPATVTSRAETVQPEPHATAPLLEWGRLGPECDEVLPPPGEVPHQFEEASADVPSEPEAKEAAREARTAASDDALGTHLDALNALSHAQRILAVLAHGPGTADQIDQQVGTSAVAERCLRTTLAPWVAQDANGVWSLASSRSVEELPVSVPDDFHTRSFDGPALFLVHAEGARTVVTLNRSHAAYDLVCNNPAAHLLLRTWAEMEIVLPTRSAERAVELREEWGRATRFFLRPQPSADAAAHPAAP